MRLFGSVVEERRTHYQENPDAVPGAADIDSLIKKYSYQNGLISGGLSLVPGPWGMIAAVPEVAMVIRNQLRLIYDIGVAYGHSKVLTKELLAGVFASSLGLGGIGLLTMHGGKVLVRRASLRVFQKVVVLLGGKVTQQMLRSQISKWLPLVGPAAMAAWSKYSTGQVGKKAVEILSKPIEIDHVDLDIDETIQTETESPTNPPDLNALKIVSLANLIKTDGKVYQQEKAYLEEIITSAELGADSANDLRKKITVPGSIPVDYTLFTKSPDDSLGLMIDLVALAKRDGEFHINEKMYIKQVGKMLGYSEDDVAVMIDERSA